MGSTSTHPGRQETMLVNVGRNMRYATAAVFGAVLGQIISVIHAFVWPTIPAIILFGLAYWWVGRGLHGADRAALLKAWLPRIAIVFLSAVVVHTATAPLVISMLMPGIRPFVNRGDIAIRVMTCGAIACNVLIAGLVRR